MPAPGRGNRRVAPAVMAAFAIRSTASLAHPADTSQDKSVCAQAQGDAPDRLSADLFQFGTLGVSQVDVEHGGTACPHAPTKPCHTSEYVLRATEEQTSQHKKWARHRSGRMHPATGMVHVRPPFC